MGIFAIVARSGWLRRSCAILAVFFVGAMTEAWHRPGPNPTIDAGSREIVILEGCVVEPSVFSQNREQFTLELDPGARARVSFNLDDDAEPQRLAYGQRVEIEARIRPPHNYNNPGSFDYALYLARQKIFWTAVMARHTTPRILPGRCGSRFWSVIYAIRTAAVDRIERLYAGDAYATGMMEAVLIGEKSKLEKVWTDTFRRTGTYHTLVIAGFHVTILAGCLLFLLRVCMLDEIPALFVTCSGAWLYALVSGANAPAVRAAAGVHPLRHRAIFLPPWTRAEPSRAGGDCLLALGSGRSSSTRRFSCRSCAWPRSERLSRLCSRRRPCRWRAR